MGSHDIGRCELEAHERRLVRQGLIDRLLGAVLILAAVLGTVWLFAGCDDHYHNPSAVLPGDITNVSVPVTPPSGSDNTNTTDVNINIFIGPPSPTPATGGRI